MTEINPLRIGILGASRVAKYACIAPAHKHDRAALAALAARNADRANAYAAEQNIPKVFDSYEALLASDEIDAVYIGLPNGLHCEWSVKALEAGKHVLCEKPISSNKNEAATMAKAAEKSGKVLMEAFHYRYHPAMKQVEDIVESGSLGTIIYVKSVFTIPFPAIPKSDIRFDYDLAGGALMDPTCYPVNMLGHLFGFDAEVLAVKTRLASPQIDRWISADLRFSNGILGNVTGSLRALVPFRMNLTINGDEGTLKHSMAFSAHNGGKINVKSQNGDIELEYPKNPETYDYQMDAFVKACLDSEPFPTTIDEGIQYMDLIDRIYRAGGLKPRGE